MAGISRSMQRLGNVAGVVALLGLMLLALPASARTLPARAAPQPAQCATSTPAGWVQLPGHIPPIMVYAHPLHPSNFSHPLMLSIGFRVRNQAELDQLMQDQHNPSSPDYHHYLTPEEYQARFGPTPQEIAQVSSFLAGFHLQVGQVVGLMMQASGSLRQVECAFAVQLYDYQLGSRVVYAPTRDPSVPAGIAPYLQAIVGLDDAAYMQSGIILQP
jgi:subtilase family serine protease